MNQVILIVARLDSEIYVIYIVIKKILHLTGRLPTRGHSHQLPNSTLFLVHLVSNVQYSQKDPTFDPK